MRRPVGVVIIGILVLIAAVLEILASLAILGVAGLAAAGKAGAALTGSVVILGVVTLAIGIFSLIFAISFLRLRRWAWWAVMIVELFQIASVVVQFVVNGYVRTALGALIVPVLIVLYLNTRKVRAAFFGPKQ